MPDVVVASWNLHCGVDGWGRPFNVVDGCRAIDADVLVLQETWSADGKAPLAEEVGDALGYRVEHVPIGRGTIYAPPPYAGRRWGPRLWSHTLHGFRIDRLPGANQREATAAPGANQAVAASRQRGDVGVAVLTRLELKSARSAVLGRFRGDPTRRSAVLASMVVRSDRSDDHVDQQGAGSSELSILLLGTHLSHLRYGSFSQMTRIRKLLAEAADTHSAVVVAGDMNLPGPAAQALLPGFKRLVRGRTWPGWSPFLQPDHILVRPPATGSGEVVPVKGSDHLPVRAVISLG